ncbi:hypothetical protein DACRYDRAFT_116106 [Dacryopinax primogenitus]|uniref:Uncharacterized protein n=1 Tax=Dacryopinax primogenitus (strain DJM 731) TaxID=1858805 RepID=M5G972_DACPD|nr:uncharacterized protein DACRYDRAFT_116106 [Dacryopinax primogenitus]EJU02417.1 hypothetical protein DACRYDRAFT_116106 [Dacryopinax primogenitus]
MSAAFYPALAHALRRTTLPNAVHCAQRLGRTISNSFIQRSDGVHVDKLIVGEAFEPYPSGPVDGLVFEDQTEEYAAFAPPSMPEVEDSTTAMNMVLQMHLREKQINRAITLIDELEAVGVPIRESDDFQLVEDDEFRPQDARTFLQVWQYVKDLKEGRIKMEEFGSQARRFVRLLGPFFREGRELLPMANFALLAAGKGYAAIIGPKVVPHLVRYGSPDFAETFVEHLLRRAGEHPGTMKVHEELGNELYNILIRGQSMNLRAQYAAQLLLRAREELGVKIAGGTYSILLIELTKGRQEALLSRIKPLALEDHPDYTWSVDSNLKSLNPESLQRETKLFELLPTATDSEVADALCELLSTPPKARISSIADFIAECVTQKRTRVMDIVDYRSNKPHQISGRSRAWTGQWSTAVMLYFYRREQYVDVIRNFVHRFQVYGLPIDDAFLQNMAVPGALKLWPSPYAIALVIQAILLRLPIREPDGSEQHADLYHKYISWVKDGLVKNHSRNTATLLANEETVTGDAPLEEMAYSFSPSAAHALPTYELFRRFIVEAFNSNKSYGHTFMLTALEDMQELGVFPNSIIWTEICLMLIEFGNPRLMSYFLDLMEGRQASIDQRDWPSDYRILQHFRDDLPRPNVMMYGRLVHHLMKKTIRATSRGEVWLSMAIDLRERMLSLGWDPRTAPNGLHRTAAMFRDLDQLIKNYDEANMPLHSNLHNSYRGIGKDAVAYQQNPNFTPRSSPLNKKEPNIELSKPGQRPPPKATGRWAPKVARIPSNGPSTLEAAFTP